MTHSLWTEIILGACGGWWLGALTQKLTSAEKEIKKLRAEITEIRAAISSGQLRR